ncbi:hypothetical protein D3C84_1164970 [compost metagenome]
MIPTLALAFFKANSALFTSGLRLIIEEGIPIEALFFTSTALRAMLLFFEFGNEPVNTLKAFS